MTEDEIVAWHHRLDGHEFEQAPGGKEGQGCLGCCSPWGHKDLDTTEQLNNIIWGPNSFRTYLGIILVLPGRLLLMC